MIRYIKRIFNWLFRRKTVAAPKRVSTRRSKEHYGSHYYLGDLLDQLDGVFKHLPKMRKTDPEAYKLYTKLGATVSDSNAVVSQDIEPHVIASLPAFGCTFIGKGNGNSEDAIPARFCYYTKVTNPINVQNSNGTVYRCGVTLDDNDKALAIEYYVSISDGEITALKQCFPTSNPIGKKKSDKNPRRQRAVFYRMSWDYPLLLKDKAEEYNKTVDEMASELFALMANFVSARESGLTVTATKRGKRAVFAIDMERTPYFFKDREKVTDENGATKKIFHIVRGHERTLAGGHKKFIKTHFRGLRRFEWNGYSVRIGLAGKHGTALSDFTLPSRDDVDANDGKYVGTDIVGEKLGKVLA